MNLIEIVITGKNLAKTSMKEAEGDAKSMGSVVQAAGKVATEALIGMAVESAHMATEFESTTTRLVTSAGESNKNLDMVRKGLLDMAAQVGVSANDLAKAMYYVESAGFHGSDGLTALKAAAQGAAAEGADTTTVVKAMTDVLVDYHLKASDAANVTSQMITAVAQGKTSLQEFSGAFASIVPAASAAGISFPDVAAALAQMTNHGFTAARASQNLAQALRSLLNPTNKMQGAFDQYGVSSATLREKLHGPNGLTDAMEYLAKAAAKAGKEGTPEFAAALKELMGTAPGANAALATVGANFDATSKSITLIGKSTKDAQGNVKGFAEVQATLGQKLKDLQASFDSLMIELGNKLLPVLKNAADFTLKHKTAVEALVGGLLVLLATASAVSTVMKIAGAATAVWSGLTKVAAAAQWLFNDACLGTRIGLAALAVEEFAVSVASKAAAAAQWLLNVAMDANPIGAVILLVMALVAGFVYLWTHCKGFREFWIGLWKELVREFMTDWHAIDNTMHVLGRFFTETVPRWFDTAVRDIKGAWHAVYDAIIAPVVHVYNDAMNLLNQLAGFIESIPGKAASAAASVGSSLLSAMNPANWFANGGVVGAAVGGPRGGMVMVGEQGPELVRLPTGSTVMPHSNTMGMLAGGDGSALRAQLELVSVGDDLWIRALRNSIRVRGGNVQKVLGVN